MVTKDSVLRSAIDYLDSLTVNIAPLQDSLRHLAAQLQPALQSLFPEVPFQVRCTRKHNQLLVLAQHPPGEAVNPQQAIRILKNTLYSLPATTIAQVFAPAPLPLPCTMTLYLRMLGQERPYAGHRFQYRPPIATEVNLPRQTAAPISPPPPTLVEESVIPLSDSCHKLLEPGSQATLSGQESPTQRPVWLWPAPLVAASVLGVLAGMTWALSRPCAIGACPPVDQAAQFNQQLPKTLATVEPPLDLQPLQQQVATLTEQLKTVPAWSASHQSAQTLLQQYQTYSAAIQQIEAAEAAATRASQKSQATTQASTNWQGVKALWQEAIAQLQTIPVNSPFYDLAQHRLRVFQQASRSVTQALTLEDRATKQLNTAQSTAKLAAIRQSTAKSLENWQLTQATWQVAVNALQKIPPTATSYSEAQKLLATYQTRLAEVRGRTAQEWLSSNGYRQAMAQAQRANSLEGQNQWTAAKTAWQGALNSAMQVPKGTFFYNQAQSLVATYEAALKLAESKLKAAINLRKIQAELQKVCAGSPQTCTYSITPSLIRVQFTSAYERAARTAYIMGQGNAPTLGGIMQHFDSLKAALQAIASNAGIPLEVYSSDNSLLGSFAP